MEDAMAKSASTALVAVDLHRGHLDPAVATMPVPPQRAAALLECAIPAFKAFRKAGVPIIHVVTEYRHTREIESNPFWKSRQSPTRGNAMRHNLAGSPGVEIMPGLFVEGDSVVNGKKRYSAFLHTGLEFLLRSVAARTVLLAGVNTNSCILSTAFEVVNRDFELVVLEDCVDSMDGPEAHAMALQMVRLCLGRVAASGEIVSELA
jgi:nicotinamidase-related amidase